MYLFRRRPVLRDNVLERIEDHKQARRKIASQTRGGLIIWLNHAAPEGSAAARERKEKEIERKRKKGRESEKKKIEYKSKERERSEHWCDSRVYRVRANHRARVSIRNDEMAITNMRLHDVT